MCDPKYGIVEANGLRNEWEKDDESMMVAVRGICMTLSRLWPRGKALLRVTL